MKLDHLALDIETIPAAPLESYSEAVQEKIREKVARLQEKRPEYDYDYFAATHGDLGQIVCISVGFIHRDETIHLQSFYGAEESQILQQFNKLIGSFGGTYIHYNGLNFDIPFLLQRMSHHNLKPADPRFANLRRYQNEPHFDLMLQYYNWDMTRTLPLGILAELHGIPSPKQDLSGSEVFAAFKKGAYEQIAHYCEFDVATTLNLWNKIFRHREIIPLEKYQFSTKSD